MSFSHDEFERIKEATRGMIPTLDFDVLTTYSLDTQYAESETLFDLLKDEPIFLAGAAAERKDLIAMLNNLWGGGSCHGGREPCEHNKMVEVIVERIKRRQYYDDKRLGKSTG